MRVGGKKTGWIAASFVHVLRDSSAKRRRVAKNVIPAKAGLRRFPSVSRHRAPACAGVTALAGLILFVALAAFCLASGSAHAADRLVLLSPHWQGIRLEFTDAFRRHYRATAGRDVELQWLDVGGGSSDIVRYIESQFTVKPAGIGVDVLFGGGTDPYLYLKDKRLLAPCRLPAAVLAAIAPDIAGMPLYDPDQRWYSASLTGFGIITNRAVLKKLGLPEPQTWADLARPEYFSWVGAADPRKSGSAHMAYEIILQAYGWEKGWQVLTAIGANARGFSSAAGQIPKDVTAGEVACGLSIDFYAWAQVRTYGPEVVGFVLPRDLTVVNGDAIAILKGAPNRALAEEFVAFVAGEAGQRLQMLNRGEPGGPVRHDLARFGVIPRLYGELKGRTSVSLNPFEGTGAGGFRFDAEKAALRRTIVDDLIGTLIVDRRPELAAAWRAALARMPAAAAMEKVTAMPLTEAQALAIARRGLWSDSAFKNRTMREFSEFARARSAAPAPWSRRLAAVPAALAVILVLAVSFSLRRRSRRQARSGPPPGHGRP
ncbi:MAG: ABC transporter substrate-binding protein [Syntrophales bacterium]